MLSCKEQRKQLSAVFQWPRRIRRFIKHLLQVLQTVDHIQWNGRQLQSTVAMICFQTVQQSTAIVTQQAVKTIATRITTDFTFCKWYYGHSQRLILRAKNMKKQTICTCIWRNPMDISASGKLITLTYCISIQEPHSTAWSQLPQQCANIRSRLSHTTWAPFSWSGPE